MRFATKCAAWLLLLTIGLFARAAEVPYLSGRVVDEAELLSPQTIDRVGGLLREHESRTGNQIVVLTTASLEGESIEEYAVRVFDTWKLGQKGKDNGVLVVVVPRERRMRIEVGYGLEGTLTDAASSRVIRNVMAPFFKAEDYNAGVEQGVTAIIAQLEGKEPPPAAALPDGPEKPGGGASTFEDPDLPLTERILFGAFIFGIIGLFTVIGVLTPGVGWFLYFFLIPFWAMFPIVVVGTGGALKLLIAYLIGFPVAKFVIARRPWYRKAQQDLKTKGKAEVGGFTLRSGGSSSSGSSWSSSSSSGGFSGGGGSSGGGGASGRW